MSQIEGNDEFAIDSDQTLDTSSTEPTAFFWDTTDQQLGAGEPNVFGITIKADRTATGTRLYKIKILEEDTDSDPSLICATETEQEGGFEYTSKTFFIKFT